MAITFDPVSKRITLDSTSVTAEEIFSRWEDWVLLSDNLKYLPAFRHTGGDNLGSGLFIPNYIFLLNGWRVRPMEANHNLTITGNLFVEGGGVPVVSTLGTYQVNVNYTVPIMAQGFSTSGVSGPSSSEIASAVRVELSPELTKIMTLESNAGLTSNQATMLLEMYELLGLDPTKPLVVTENSRVAGSISQTIVTSETETMIMRN